MGVAVQDARASRSNNPPLHGWLEECKHLPCNGYSPPTAGLLLDREATSRENRRLGHRLRQARLRQTAVIEDIDYRTPRGFDRALFQKLASCDWIRASQYLVIGGPTGVGKSWLACALGHKACREGLSVLYRRPHACLLNSPRRGRREPAAPLGEAGVGHCRTRSTGCGRSYEA